MPRGHPTKTPERLKEAQRLHKQGIPQTEIAELLGVRPSTINVWINDPDGTRTRARKDTYARPCVDCGTPTSGSEGRRAEPRCFACANPRTHAHLMVWTLEEVIEAIRDWVAMYGEPPAMADWNPVQARVRGDEQRALRFERADGRWPWSTRVSQRYGWNNAIRAAGQQPRQPGGGNGNTHRRTKQTA